MGRPQINGTISVGNILTMVTMIVAAAAAVITLQVRDDEREKQISRIETMVSSEVDARTSLVASIEARVRVVENIQARNQARYDERFVAVLAALERIDDRLNRVLQNIGGPQR